MVKRVIIFLFHIFEAYTISINRIGSTGEEEALTARQARQDAPVILTHQKIISTDREIGFGGKHPVDTYV